MKKITLTFTAILLATFLSACSSPNIPENIPTSPPTREPVVLIPTPSIVEVIPTKELVAEPIVYNHEMFKSVTNCQACHNNLVDEAGNDVSNVTDWQASIMAQAAIDPYYLASVSAEMARHPELKEAIEDKCATCHMPMAHFAVHAEDGTSTIFGINGFTHPGHPLYDAAHEAISCTVCHQMQSDNFGAEASYSGNLLIDTITQKGERTLFGPYPTEVPNIAIMQAGSGYLIEQSDHLAQSKLCATCHTLETHYLTSNGTLSEKTFPEQTPYLEWLASDYATEQSCQDCHMPKAEGGVVLTAMASDTRSPFYKHTFTGGNVYMLELLKKFNNEIDIQNDTASFDKAIQETKNLLQQQSAELAITSATITNSQLDLRIALKTLTGHKFPSGFPSRRAWLHVTVTDSAGAIIFESGAYESNGTIIGNDNDEDDAIFEPHYAEITSDNQVQIYESIMQDDQGNVTTALLLATNYVKDNRLLPSGFDKATADARIAVRGEATTDEDFIGAGDVVHYGIELDSTSAPLTVEVELLYQTIGYRWAQNLGQEESLQIDNFLRFYDEMPNIPIVIAQEEVEISN